MQNPIKEALLQRGDDLARVMTGKEASLAIDELMNEAGCSPDQMREFWATPEESLGPFSELPPEVKKGLGESALFNYVEWHSLSSPLLDKAVHGCRSRLGHRLIKLGWILIHRLDFKGGGGWSLSWGGSWFPLAGSEDKICCRNTVSPKNTTCHWPTPCGSIAGAMCLG